MKKTSKYLLSLSMVISFIILAVGSTKSEPKGEVLNVDRNTTFRKDKANIWGEDIGWTIKPTIKNIGGDGMLTIHAKISTNMGDFSQYRDVHFDKSEIKILEFVFWEPNVLTKGSYDVKFIY